MGSGVGDCDAGAPGEDAESTGAGVADDAHPASATAAEATRARARRRFTRVTIGRGPGLSPADVRFTHSQSHVGTRGNFAQADVVVEQLSVDQVLDKKAQQIDDYDLGQAFKNFD